MSDVEITIVMPTKEEFREYSGEDIAGKLAGDIKEQDKLLEILFRRCYKIICINLRGIKRTELDEFDVIHWKHLLMEQAESLLSLGDSALIDKSMNLGEMVPKMASLYGLWRHNIRVH